MGMRTGEGDDVHSAWFHSLSFSWEPVNDKDKGSQEVKGIYTIKQLSKISFVVMEVHLIFGVSAGPGEESARGCGIETACLLHNLRG